MAFRMAAMNLRADGSPVRVWGELVTPNFFDLLRVTPMLSRGFLASEGEMAGSAPVAVAISEALWRRVFAADASIVGRADAERSIVHHHRRHAARVPPDRRPASRWTCSCR